MTITTKSEKITEGLRKSFQTIDCKMANCPCYGYAVDANGELVIQKTEAAVIRWIFDRYLAGDSLGKIATGWNCEAISKLLSNEKYIGAVLLQKTVSICGACSSRTMASRIGC